MLDPIGIGTIVLGMLLGALALAYLIILTMIRISIDRRRRRDKSTNG